MKLLRIGPAGSEKPAALVGDDSYVDLSDVVDDFDERFFGSGGLDQIRALVAERMTDPASVRTIDGQRIGAPIARPHQILCIGLNYSDHAAETGQAVPAEPILFTRSPNTLVGPNDDVRIPRGSTKPDWEVELGIVIGSRTSYLDSVDEIEDVLALDMWLDVNGVRRQTGSTATMIFDPYLIVHHLSQLLVLEPGDLINTGTPPGVGMGFQLPIWLQPGDVMELGIEGLGRQRQNVLAPR